MAFDVKQIGAQAARIAQHRRTGKILIWSISIVIIFGVLLGLVAPPLLRGKIASELSNKLHRQVLIEQISINPYAMTVSVRGFEMKERQSQSPALSFAELYVNLQLQSLFRLAPIIQELRLVKPYINLVRQEDLKYNFQDLIDEFSAGPAGPTPRFALYNIEILDGRVDFDDRPEKTKHAITQIKLAIPFISSLPSYADVKVKPEFFASVNGAPFHLAGDAKPFTDSRDSTLGVDIDKMEIAKYLEYIPVQLNFKIPAGQINGKITAVFRAGKGKPAVLTIHGDLGLRGLEMRQTNGAPLLMLPELDVAIGTIEVLANKAALKSIKSQGLQLHLNRGRDGVMNVANLIATPAKPNPNPPQAKQNSQPFAYAVDEIAVEAATLNFSDEAPTTPYKTRFDNVRINVTSLSNENGKMANVEISFTTEAKEKFTHSGALQLSPLRVEGKLDVEGLKPGALRPYYENALAAELKDGTLDLSTRYSFEKKTGPSDFKLTELNATLRSLRIDLAGQTEPLWRMASMALKNGSLDIGKKTAIIGALEAKDGGGYLLRDRDGTMNLARIAKAQPAVTPSDQPANAGQAEWKIEAKAIAFDRLRIEFDDRANSSPAKLDFSDLSLRVENYSNAIDQGVKATLRSRVNNKGTLNLAGTATLNPVSAKFAVDGRDIDFLPFQPYVADAINFLITGGSLGAKGDVSYDAGARGPAKVNYQGSLRVADFGTVEKTGAQDLLKWQSLALDAIQLDSEPFQLRIGEITLSEFYSRLIIRPDGRINLQNLTGKHDEETAPAKTAEKAQPAATVQSAPAKPIIIGKINLQNGNINFSDYFIKPNYSANLTGVQGSISELKPEAPGDIELQAKLDYAAPVEIKGKINPLSKELLLDLAADAREIELSPLSPYAGKYVGYGIDKGKLSFNVKYKLDNRKLNAENKIILNQLTFGDKIDSPDATKLPVLLAVALLKDRNGVIDVDLPISGSLDDPQFSVGGIVWRIIINIITNAVTAPFTLLASVFGGSGASGDELSYVEFDSGRANLNQASQAKIATLAKALNNRPALTLELSGRTEPATDLDGLKRVGIERKVKAQKLKDLVRKGEAIRSLDDVQLAGSEYAQYLKAAYGEESFPKPRNVIGLAQDLPVPEMEKLMIQHAKISDDEMRQLANQRAQNVRNALLATGLVGADRLFVVAAKPFSSDERAQLKGKPNRVDFAMK